MKHVLFALMFAASASFGADLQTIVCSSDSSCAKIPQSLEQLNAGRGWSACGVVPGEKTVKVVDSKNSFVGFACILTSEGGAF